MSKHIDPTIGRVVNYRGKDGEIRAAIVTKVHGSFCINLYVLGHDAGDVNLGYHTSVTHADPAHEPKCFPSWHWMPYQLGQAARTEAAEAKVTQPAPAPTRSGVTITREAIEALLAASVYCDTKMGNKTTVVVCILPNGFEVVESSGCVDPANYNHELGVSTCKRRIVDRVWQLEGYRLQSVLACAK